MRVCSPGFQVVGGENSGRMDLGTIVSSITPGGPADVNGCLKPGMPGFCHTLFCVGSVCFFMPTWHLADIDANCNLAGVQRR